MDKKIKTTIAALEKNNFDVVYVDNTSQAKEELLMRIPVGVAVGVGGSMTLKNLSFIDDLESRGNKVYWHMLAPDFKQFDAIYRKANSCEIYLSGINALTEDGKLVNIDGSGNRVSALAFGPTKIISVCGVNKIVKNVAQGLQRIKKITAPAITKLFELNTPCAVTGICENCSSEDRICNIISIMQKKPGNKSFTIILVNQELGF